MFKQISTLVSLAIISSAAAAQSTTEKSNNWRLSPEFSIGAGYGLTKLKDDEFKEDEAAKKIFALVKFNEYIGLEASYIDFDKAGNDVLTMDADGKSLAVIFEAPISEAFSLYVKGGQLWWDADASIDAINASDNYDGDEAFWGGGAKFRLSDNLDLRIEYERFDFKISRDEIDVLQQNDINMNVDFASINLQFTF
jgi:OOP family OmpA-OmpF porin